MSGFIVPSWMSLSSNDNFDKFVNNNVSLKIGQIIDVNYPSEENGFKTVTYNVIINEKSDSYNQFVLYNCQLMDKFGGLADFATYTLRNNSKDITGITQGKVESKDLLGSYVLVGLINGSASTPLILGGLPFVNIPDGSERKVPSEEDGHNLKFVFNGINVEINKDGELIATKNGPTKADGTLDTEQDGGTEEQKGSCVKIDKDGTITLSANDKHIFIINKKDKEVTLDGEKVNINQGSNGAARKEDEIKSTNVEDAKFWTWMMIFKTILSTPVNEIGLGAPSVFQQVLNAALASLFPDSLTGKITKASDSVKIG